MESAGEINTTNDIKEVYKQLNMAFPESNPNAIGPRWVEIRVPSSPLVRFRMSILSSYDAVIYWYLCALGVNCIEVIGVAVDTTGDQHSIRVFDIEFNSASLKEFKDKDHFSQKKIDNLHRCHHAFLILKRIFEKCTTNTLYSVQPCGPIFTCEGSSITLSPFELICVLYQSKETNLEQYGLRLKFIKEKCTATQVTFLIEFYSLHYEGTASHIYYGIKDEHSELLAKAITQYRLLVDEDVDKQLFLANIPMVTFEQSQQIKPLIDKQEALRRYVESPHLDLTAHRQILIDNLHQLTSDIFPQAKWISIATKDKQLVFSLTNLTAVQLTTMHDVYRHWKNGSKLAQIAAIANRKFLKFESLMMLIPENQDIWNDFFQRKSLLKSLAEHENLFYHFKAFTDILSTRVDVQFGINNNKPAIRFIGKELSVALIKAYVFSWQMTTPRVDSPAVDIIFNVETFPCRIEPLQFSQENACYLIEFGEAFEGLAELVYQNLKAVRTGIELDCSAIVYTFVFTEKSALDHAKLFFSYLNDRYPQFIFTTSTNKKSGTLSVNITVSEKYKNDPRGLFAVDSIPKLHNDFLYILPGLFCEIPTVKKKYRNSLSWEAASADFKLALAKRLVTYIQKNSLAAVRSFFEFGELDMYAPLPGMKKRTAMEYAQEVEAFEVYEYLHKKFAADTSKKLDVPIRSFISNPNFEGPSLMNFIKETITDPSSRILDALISESNSVNHEESQQKTEKKAKTSNVSKTQDEPTAIKFIKSFCHAATFPATWQVVTKERQSVQLIHAGEIGIGLLFDFFMETKLSCEWQATTLTVTLEDLTQWHAERFSEQQGGVDMINANVNQLKQRLDILAALLSIVRPIMGISDWHATATSCECLFRDATKTEDLTHYLAKRANIMVLLDWARLQCGLIENPFTICDQENGTALQITYVALKQPEWLKLIDDNKSANTNRTFLKNGRKLASVISSITTPLHDVNRVELLNQEMLKQQSKPVEAVQPETDAVKVKPATAKKSQQKADKPKRSNKADHKAKTAAISKATAAASAPAKAKTKMERGPRIAPQDQQRLQTLDKLPHAPQANINMPAANVIDFNLFAPANAAHKEQRHQSSPEKLQKLAQPITLEQSEIMTHLDNWLTQIDQIVTQHQQYCQQESLQADSLLSLEQQAHIQNQVAAWHCLHAEIASILAMLPENHPAKLHLFNHHLYTGRRTYDRQKHQYFPPVEVSLVTIKLCNSPYQYCFAKVAPLREAIAQIAQSQYPSEKLMNKAIAIIQDWSKFLEAEFSNHNILQITAEMEAHTFTKWLQSKIKQYTTHIQKLLSKPANLTNNLAIEFYLKCVGELVGHIPKYARNSYLAFSRDFRNAVAHAYDRNQSVFTLNRPPLDLALLQAELTKPTSPRFFIETNPPVLTTLYVNKTYDYQNDDIILLIELRLAAISRKLQKPAPLVVCEHIELTANTQLYSLLAKKIQQLDEQIQLHQSPLGMLFIPVECEGIKSAIAMKFVSESQDQKSQMQLKEICFANVCGFNASIQRCMDAIPIMWAKTSPNKNMPVLKALETVAINPENALSSGVLQVELLAQLAERRLIADHLLDFNVATRLPVNKKKAINQMLLELRSTQLELAWNNGQHSFYFKQQLRKTTNSLALPEGTHTEGPSIDF